MNRWSAFTCALLCLVPVMSFAETVKINVVWDTFNSNMYRGLIALPEVEGQPIEYINGDNDTSRDGHVTGGSDSGSIFSSTSVSWTIENPKKGLYKVYLFPETNNRPNKAVWSSDVTVKVQAGGRTHTIKPKQKRGNVWYVCAFEGRSLEVFEQQSFYPVRHMIYGTVRDGMSGRRVSGTRVELINRDTGKVMPNYTTKTDAQGFYLIHSFPMGRFKVRLSKKSYIQTTKETNFILRDLPVQFNAMLSPVFDKTNFRTVLSWGKKPADLDAHITGPGDGGSGSFHISYQNMHVYNKRHTLDIDDTDSYGPETVTLKGLDPGSYEYFVHDYTNRKESAESWALSLADAEVTVYRGDEQIAQFSAPEADGTLWRVFSIDGRTGKIKPHNTLEYVETP